MCYYMQAVRTNGFLPQKPENCTTGMRGWRNWQTRTFEGRVVHTIRVQVPSLAPEFARTSPAWLWDVFVLRAVVQEAFLVRRREEARAAPFLHGSAQAAVLPGHAAACSFPVRPAASRPRGILRPSLLAVASRAIPHQTAALFLHLFLPVPERLLLPSSPFRQRTAFHLDRHASVLIFDGRELPGDRRPAA